MARRIGLADLATAKPHVVGEWTLATSTPASSSEGSLFDSMRTPDAKAARLPTTAPPTKSPVQALVTTTTTTSLFDSTEIFYENFTKPDAGSVIVSEDFKPLLEAINRNASPLKSKFPSIPDKFMDVIKNHTNTLKSLYRDRTTTTLTTTLPATTTTTTTLPERSLFSASLQSDSNESTFSVSRPSGKVDESLIVPALRRQTRLDVSLEKNSRFGLSRPTVRGVVTESDRSSDTLEKTVKYFKNHKYSFLTHSRNEKDLTIEEILVVSRTKKDFELSQRFKPKYPVYVKKNVAHSNSGRNAREQDLKMKRLLENNLPFVTGRIFDSGTGKVEELDLDKSRSLFLEARDDDEENENDNSEDLDDADEDEYENVSTEEWEEDDEDSEIDDEFESDIVIETYDGFDDEGSGDYVGLGSLYRERQLNDAEDDSSNKDEEEYDYEEEEKEDSTKNNGENGNENENDVEEDNDEESDDEEGEDAEGEDEEGDDEEDKKDKDEDGEYEEGDDEEGEDEEGEDEEGEDEESEDEGGEDEESEDEEGEDEEGEEDKDEDVEYEGNEDEEGEKDEYEGEEERKNGDSVSEFDEEKERSINSDERSNQKGQEMTRNSHQNIPFPGPAHYRLVPHYPLPVPLQYYRPVQYQLVPRPYAYINRGQHFYSAFI